MIDKTDLWCKGVSLESAGSVTVMLLLPVKGAEEAQILSSGEGMRNGTVAEGC